MKTNIALAISGVIIVVGFVMIAVVGPDQVAYDLGHLAGSIGNVIGR